MYRYSSAFIYLTQHKCWLGCQNNVYSRYFLSIIITITALSIMPVNAQVSIDEVKLSGDYRWGEAFSTERDEAIALARQDLIEGISVIITSSVEVQTEEMDENVTSEFQSNVRTQSQMVLQGLGYLDEKRRDGSWRVVAFISNEDLEKSVEREQKRLSAKLIEAYSAEQNGEYNKALRLYFETFIESYNIPPEPILVDSSLFSGNINIRQYTRDEIIEWLNSIELVATDVQSSSSETTTELYIEVKATIENQPVSNIQISVNRPDYGQHLILNGFTQIFYDRKPESKSQRINFKITPNISILPANLRPFAEQVSPERVKPVTVDFGNVIEIDFKAIKLSDGSFRFSPRVMNVSVTQLEWNFGDGTTTTEVSPRHQFQNEDYQNVSLTLNRSENLSVSKEINRTDRVSFLGGDRDLFTPRSVLAESRYRVPFQHIDYIERIRRMLDFKSLESYLVRLNSSNVIRMGGARSVRSEDDSYIIITDPETEKVEAILSPIQSYLRYLITEDELTTFGRSEWRSHFRGYIPIWVEFQ